MMRLQQGHHLKSIVGCLEFNYAAQNKKWDQNKCRMQFVWNRYIFLVQHLHQIQKETQWKSPLQLLLKAHIDNQVSSFWRRQIKSIHTLTLAGIFRLLTNAFHNECAISECQNISGASCRFWSAKHKFKWKKGLICSSIDGFIWVA